MHSIQMETSGCSRPLQTFCIPPPFFHVVIARIRAMVFSSTAVGLFVWMKTFISPPPISWPPTRPIAFNRFFDRRQQVIVRL
jgi:hypothetical protein